MMSRAKAQRFRITAGSRDGCFERTRHLYPELIKSRLTVQGDTVMPRFRSASDMLLLLGLAGSLRPFRTTVRAAIWHVNTRLRFTESLQLFLAQLPLVLLVHAFLAVDQATPKRLAAAAMEAEFFRT